MTLAEMYPVSIADIARWARVHGVKIHEANIRFMEYVILTCVASTQPLGRSVALKGGNALRCAYHSPRSTKDLDFSVDTQELPDDPDALREILDGALKMAEQRFGVKAKCQRVKRNPPNPRATHPTYDIAVGYQFPEDRYFQDFETRAVATVVPLEISFLDMVCETRLHPLSEDGVTSLRVCTLEDILAEKLRSLLQQRVRNRNRPQDVFDVARYTMEYEGNLDCVKIAEYLKRKSGIRNVEVRKSAFDDEIRELASFEYDGRIRQQAGESFIPFGTAWKEVLSLVNTLDIPE